MTDKQDRLELRKKITIILGFPYKEGITFSEVEKILALIPDTEEIYKAGYEEACANQMFGKELDNTFAGDLEFRRMVTGK